MHLCVCLIMHHGIFHVEQASFITCSAYESEKVRGDQVSEKIHPSVVLVSMSNSVILSMEPNLLCNAGKPWCINSLLVFTNLYYTLSLVRYALSN